MSLYFFDSSALIKRYVTEKGSLGVRQIVQNTSHKIFLSQITPVEIVSALPTIVFMCGDIKLTNIATQEGLQVDDPNLYL